MESHWVLAACCCLARVENNGPVQGFLFVQVVAMAAFNAGKSGSAKEQRTLLVVLCPPSLAKPRCVRGAPLTCTCLDVELPMNASTVKGTRLAA